MCNDRRSDIYNSAKLTLEEVIRIICSAETQGKTIVRLHTGDPSIYGAVREQMDELDKRGISYESCPGVSACFGAAASFNLEYTLPGISQSLIITRMEGKTEVPKKESIESFAAHQASMAIYLSAGMIQELSKRLLEGGYQKTTPAALIYKATWDEEEAYTCTIETLFDTSVRHGITKTALVLVGDVITHQNYRKSRLYASDFSTAFRENKEEAPSKKVVKTIPLSMISFTENGIRLSEEIAERLKNEVEIEDAEVEAIKMQIEASLCTKCKAGIDNHTNASVQYIKESVSTWAREQMEAGTALLFIGACGIAVRAIAPFLRDKLHDAPVLVMDEKGRYVIPILSGHMGGANKLAECIAKRIGAKPVITTATDINRVFAVDVFARRNGLCITEKEGIAKVSSKALTGKEVSISVEPEHGVDNTEHVCAPRGIRIVPYPPVEPVDVVITSKEGPYDGALVLRPKEYVIGLGCKKGKNADELGNFILKKINELGISITQIFALSSISHKRNESGIMEWCQKEGIMFLTYTAEELQMVIGNFKKSSFVEEQVGVDNVCERAALKTCETGGKLIAPKYAENGMTIAVAKRAWKVCFYDE